MARLSRKKVVTVTVAVLMTAAGAAYAYWTAGGSGTGTGATGTASALVVRQTSTVSAMAPGAAAQTLSGNFDNPNTAAVYVTAVTAGISSVTKAVGAPAGTCDAGDYTLTGAEMTVDAQVAVGNASGSWSGATLAFNSTSANQDACKGATVNLAYTAS